MSLATAIATKRGLNRGCQVKPAFRLAIYLRDSFRCVYCCTDLHSAAPMDITLDHLTCQADGGTNEARNLVTACRKCNCSRRDMPLSKFAGPETRKDIRRLTARKLDRYRVLARALIAGKTGENA